jgi:hypothetical protein
MMRFSIMKKRIWTQQDDDAPRRKSWGHLSVIFSE